MLSSWVAFNLSGDKKKMTAGRASLTLGQWDVWSSLLVFLHQPLCSFPAVEQVSAAERGGGVHSVVIRNTVHLKHVSLLCSV